MFVPVEKIFEVQKEHGLTRALNFVKEESKNLCKSDNPLLKLKFQGNEGRHNLGIASLDKYFIKIVVANEDQLSQLCKAHEVSNLSLKYGHKLKFMKAFGALYCKDLRVPGGSKNKELLLLITEKMQMTLAKYVMKLLMEEITIRVPRYFELVSEINEAIDLYERRAPAMKYPSIESSEILKESFYRVASRLILEDTKLILCKYTNDIITLKEILLNHLDVVTAINKQILAIQEIVFRETGITLSDTKSDNIAVTEIDSAESVRKIQIYTEKNEQREISFPLQISYTKKKMLRTKSILLSFIDLDSASRETFSSLKVGKLYSPLSHFFPHGLYSDLEWGDQVGVEWNRNIADAFPETVIQLSGNKVRVGITSYAKAQSLLSSAYEEFAITNNSPQNSTKNFETAFQLIAKSLPETYNIFFPDPASLFDFMKILAANKLPGRNPDGQFFESQ